MAGFIVLQRDLFDKPIWLKSSVEQKVILIALIEMANFVRNEWEWEGKPFVCERGQFITSLPSIAEKCGKGVSIQNVRTALKRFEMFEFLTDKSTGQGRLITICNYSKYQDVKENDNRPANRRPTDDQQTANRQLTANNHLTIKPLNHVTNNLLPDSGESENQSKISPIAKTAKPKKTRLSKDAELTDQFKQSAVAYWQSKNRTDLDPLEEYGKFKNHHVANGTTSACWKSSWSTWYTNAIKFNPVRLNHGNRQPANQQNDHIDWHSPFLDEDAIAEAERLMQRRGGQPVY